MHEREAIKKDTPASGKAEIKRSDCFLSLCLPAFNEAMNIDATIKSAIAVLDALEKPYEIVVIDDGSQDATGSIVRSRMTIDGRIRLVSHQLNRGYGAALNAALRAARGDLVLLMDSDGQFNINDLWMFLDKSGDYDVVIGYRERRADPYLRRLNAWCWNRAIRIVLGLRVKDIDCGFKLLRRTVVDGLRLSATGACINAQILLQCLEKNYKCCEIGVRHFPRRFGRPTGARLTVILHAVWELVCLRRSLNSPRLMQRQM
jgi:glycosyltransferase involved in cell wall biosynthesis